MAEYATETGALIAELFAMAHRDPNPGTENFAAFLMADKPRTREIGERLNEIGGHALMLQTHAAVVATCPPYCGQHLEIAWNGIGDWRA